jgi:hypothetical protein
VKRIFNIFIGFRSSEIPRAANLFCVNLIRHLCGFSMTTRKSHEAGVLGFSIKLKLELKRICDLESGRGEQLAARPMERFKKKLQPFHRTRSQLRVPTELKTEGGARDLDFGFHSKSKIENSGLLAGNFFYRLKPLCRPPN